MFLRRSVLPVVPAVRYGLGLLVAFRMAWETPIWVFSVQLAVVGIHPPAGSSSSFAGFERNE